MKGTGNVMLPPGGKTITDVHGTPPALFAALSAEFGGFDLDPCSDGTNALCERFFTPASDGLQQEWTGRVFMNPPYTACYAWMRKAWASAQCGALVVCLVPVRTDTAWWHEFAMRGEVRFIRGRLVFGNATANAPFPSAIVVFGAGVPGAMTSVARPLRGRLKTVLVEDDEEDLAS